MTLEINAAHEGQSDKSRQLETKPMSWSIHEQDGPCADPQTSQTTDAVHVEISHSEAHQAPSRTLMAREARSRGTGRANLLATEMSAGGKPISSCDDERSDPNEMPAPADPSDVDNADIDGHDTDRAHDGASIASADVAAKTDVLEVDCH